MPVGAAGAVAAHGNLIPASYLEVSAVARAHVASRWLRAGRCEMTARALNSCSQCRSLRINNADSTDKHLNCASQYFFFFFLYPISPHTNSVFILFLLLVFPLFVCFFFLVSVKGSKNALSKSVHQ